MTASFTHAQAEICAELIGLYRAAFAAIWPDVPYTAAAAWAARYGARAARLTQVRVTGMEAAVAECLRTRGRSQLDTDAHAFATAEAMRALAVAAKGTDADEGYHAEHSQRVAAFTAALLALWAQLQHGELTSAAYRKAVGQAFDQAVAGAPPAAADTLARLRQTALDRAAAFEDAVSLPDDDEDAPSEAQRANWANIVSGALWAAGLAIAAYAHHQRRQERGEVTERQQGEPASADNDTVMTWRAKGGPAMCEDCDTLDGQTWFLSAVPFWPGEGETQCAGNCRCSLEPTDTSQD
jgi:hypothetical protein